MPPVSCGSPLAERDGSYEISPDHDHAHGEQDSGNHVGDRQQPSDVNGARISSPSKTGDLAPSTLVQSARDMPAIKGQYWNEVEQEEEEVQ